MRTYRARFDVNRPNVYQLAKAGEDVADVLGRHAQSILQVQTADVPGREAPGAGAQGDRAGSAASFGWL